MVAAEEHLLAVRNLCTYFHTEEGLGKAVDGVSFELRRGETLGLVGESGCGKSVSALSVMRLIPQPPGQIESGEILFGGQDLLRLSEEEMCRVRGDEIAMIFQEPMTSLNPVLTCGFQIAESVILHQGVSKQEARNRAIEMLRLVGIPAPEQRVDEYPHQLSGGMRQRVVIGMAMALEPELLIMDEPTTALDVIVQRDILQRILDLQSARGFSVLFITHDLPLIFDFADRVAIMRHGELLEEGTVDVIRSLPQHTYTRELLEAQSLVR